MHTWAQPAKVMGLWGQDHGIATQFFVAMPKNQWMFSSSWP
jgi:hypothetical protein